ncbi:interferon regulatory factor 9 [Ara ararauna]
MAPAPPQRRLRAWLLEQVESGRYAGLVWDDPERTALRIPWQRGGKGGAGSALCKAWAEFKGRVAPGAPPDPAGWKSRLRCALHKSPEFQELPHRSRPHGQNPYRVYRVLPPRPEGGSAGPRRPPPQPPEEPPPIGSCGSPAPEEEEGAEPEEEGGASPGPAPTEAPPPPVTLTVSSPHPLPPAEGPLSLLLSLRAHGAPCCSLHLPPGDFLLEPPPHPPHSQPPERRPSPHPPLPPYRHLLPHILLAPSRPHSAVGRLLRGFGLLVASARRGLFLRLRRPPGPQGALRLRAPHADALPPGELVLAFDAERFRREVREHREGAPRPQPSVSLELGESPGAGICIQLAQAFAQPLLDEPH